MTHSASRIAACLVVMATIAFSLLNVRSVAASDQVRAADVASQYCTQEGGVAQKRTPWYGTNGSGGLHLAGVAMFCKFTSSQDGSRIYLTLPTLYTPNPTLAALAYYAEVQPGSCNGNPASCYCTLLGGSDQFGGTTGAGGGWGLKNVQDEVLEACIFPDMSSIDSWGLFYHSAGIIRGTDLNGILRYPDPYDGKNEKK